MGVIDIDVHRGEHLEYRELEPATWVKMKKLIPTSDGVFKVIPLDDNPLRIVKIWSELPVVVREVIMNCLKANIDLFVVSPKKIPEIYTIVTCHHLNMDLISQYVSEKMTTLT